MWKGKYRKVGLVDINERVYNSLYESSYNVNPFLSLDWLIAISKSSFGYSLRFIEFYHDDEILGYYPFWERFYGIVKVSNIWGGYSGYVAKQSINWKGVRGVIKQNNFNTQDLPMISLSKKDYVTWIKDIRPSYDDIMSSVHPKTRNQIRKSEKYNLYYKDINSKEEVIKCYDIYKKLIRKHDISKSLSIDTFFELINSNNIYFIGCFYQGEIIAYSVFLKHKEQSFYWLNASNDQYSKLNPTNGILNFFIKKAKEIGIQSINFGAIPYGNRGLSHFKSRWGVEEYKYYSVLGVNIF